MKNEVKVSGNTIIIVYNGEKIIRNINSIRFCRAVCRYSEIYFDKDKPVLAPVGINKLALLLPEEFFFICHRRYIIHLGILHDAIVKEDKIIYHSHFILVSRHRNKKFRDKTEVFHTSGN